MGIAIREIYNQETWDSFVLGYPEKTFLHSWQWGEFNRATGEKIWRLGLYEEEMLRGVALIIKVVARRGTFLFCPHGPLIDWGNKTQFSTLIDFLKNLAHKEQAYFIRISPLARVPLVGITRGTLASFHFRPAPIHMHAETTWTLDLAPSEEQLLAAMRKTTRNLIRRAEREGVTVEFEKEIPLSSPFSKGGSRGILDAFYSLHEKTVERQHFVPFSKKYIMEEVQAFLPNNILVGIAKVGETPIAGAVVPLDNTAGYYHHGASIPSKIPATYLLQWRIIQELQRRGLRYYNFWGIAPTDNPKHPWHGLSLFKQGFGGFRTDYLHAQDLPLSWRYWINYTIESLRRWKRGV